MSTLGDSANLLMTIVVMVWLLTDSIGALL